MDTDLKFKGNAYKELQTSNFKPQNKAQIPINNTQEKTIVYDIRERLLNFTKNIYLICRNLPKTSEFDCIRKQLMRAASSVGANFEEADGSLTRKDFINKVGIARKEAKETKYWLNVINNTSSNVSNLSAQINEAEEIIRILSAILKKCGYKFRN